MIRLPTMAQSLRRRLIRFAFHLLYHQLAFAYDAVAWSVSLGQWQAWGQTALDRIRGPRVLELGHGPGHMLIALARSGRSPIGIDLSPNMIRIARERIRRAGLLIPQVRCRVEALPFRTGVFDSAVATFPTDYIADPRTLREVARVTNERGRLVVVVGAQLVGKQPNVRLIDWLYRITGQSHAVIDQTESVFDQIKMPARIELESIGASTVTVLIAEKTPGAAGISKGDQAA